MYYKGRNAKTIFLLDILKVKRQILQFTFIAFWLEFSRKILKSSDFREILIEAINANGKFRLIFE